MNELHRNNLFTLPHHTNPRYEENWAFERYLSRETITEWDKLVAEGYDKIGAAHDRFYSMHYVPRFSVFLRTIEHYMEAEDLRIEYCYKIKEMLRARIHSEVPSSEWNAADRMIAHETDSRIDCYALQRDNTRKKKSRISRYFEEVYAYCREEHRCLETPYELGLVYYHQGEDAKSITMMEEYGEAAQESGGKKTLDYYRTLNETYQSTMQYEKAVQLLTEAIEQHPDEKGLYIQRIAANFELGREADVAKDYISHNFEEELKVDPSKSELALAFAKGASRGCVDGLKEYPFTLLASFRGSAQLLWTTVTDPIGTPKAIMEDIQNVMTILKSGEAAELCAAISPDLGDLVKNWDTLDPTVRWEKIGYVFGKNGFDCLSFFGQRKILDIFVRLRSTNVLANVKTSFASTDKKAKIQKVYCRKLQGRVRLLKEETPDWLVIRKILILKKLSESGRVKTVR